MPKIKKKLTAIQKRVQKAAKAEWQKKYEWIFINGKQVRVRKFPMIDGIDSDEFIQINTDLIWLHQNEMWEYIKADNDDI